MVIKKNLKKKIKISLFSLLILLIIIASSIFMAKYVLKIENNDLIASNDFVFFSDYLNSDSNIIEYVVNSESITFTIKNNEDENIFITDDNIPYTISTTCGTLSSSSGTLTKNTNNQDEITLTRSKVGDTCIVTATSTSPYRLALKAKFIFAGVVEKTNYKITDNGYFITLDLFTGNVLENINIEYSGFKPDTGNEFMKTWTSGSTGIISANNLEKQSHYELNFKKDTVNGIYNTDDLLIYTTIINLDS